MSHWHEAPDVQGFRGISVIGAEATTKKFAAEAMILKIRENGT
jgi:hypothetical protein